MPGKNPNDCAYHYYNDAVAETKQVVMAGATNFYGFLVENNSATDAVYLQIFNKLTADVTVGTTPPDYTVKIPAGSTVGKDASAIPMHYHDLGIVIAVTSGRTNATAPNAAATVHIWNK